MATHTNGGGRLRNIQVWTHCQGVHHSQDDPLLIPMVPTILLVKHITDKVLLHFTHRYEVVLLSTILLLGHAYRRQVWFCPNQVLSESYITYVSTYISRVCNYTRLLHGRMDIVQGVLIGKRYSKEPPCIPQNMKWSRGQTSFTP